MLLVTVVTALAAVAPQPLAALQSSDPTSAVRQIDPVDIRDAVNDLESSATGRHQMATQTCFSTQLFALITGTYERATNISINTTVTDVSAESEISVQTVELTQLSVTTNTIVLSAILVLSLMLLFYGQMLALPSVVFISVLGSLCGGFVLFHFLINRHDDLAYSTWVCWGPFVLALALTGAVAVLFLGFKERLPWLTAFIFGGSKGFLGALAARELFESVFPDTAESPKFPLYFWIFAGLSTLTTALISAHHRTSDGKSVVVIYMVVFFGAYGTSVSIDSLINLHREPLPNWAFLVIFLFACVFGAVFQLFISGTSAKENRETAKKGADKARELTRSASQKLAGAPASDNAEPLVKP